MPPGDSVDDLVEDWHNRLSEAIDEVAPRRPLHSRSNLAPWYTLELRKQKQELRWLERVWRKTRDEASRTSYKTLMNSYEMAIRIAKKDFYAIAIASASSRPAQLFKTIRSLTSLSSGPSQNNKMEISCEAFASFFVEKILRLCQDFSAEVEAVSEVEAPLVVQFLTASACSPWPMWTRY